MCGAGSHAWGGCQWGPLLSCHSPGKWMTFPEWRLQRLFCVIIKLPTFWHCCNLSIRVWESRSDSAITEGKWRDERIARHKNERLKWDELLSFKGRVSDFLPNTPFVKFSENVLKLVSIHSSGFVNGYKHSSSRQLLAWPSSNRVIEACAQDRGKSWEQLSE